MRQITWAFTILTMLPIEAMSCEPDLCFNWKISNMKLILVCRIVEYKFNTYIEDPSGNIQGNCFPPSDISTCHAKYNNTTITLDRQTNELTFTLRGVMNTKVNGNWTCRHGEKRDIAHVEVTVLKYHDNQSDGKSLQTTFENQCIYLVVFMSSLSFIAATAMTVMIMSFLPRISYTNDDFLMTTAKVLLFCCNKEDKRMQYFSKLKKVVYVVSTVFFFGIATLIGSIDKKDCSTKWLFFVLGSTIGFVCSLTCLSKDKVSLNSNGNTGNKQEHKEPNIEEGQDDKQGTALLTDGEVEATAHQMRGAESSV